MPLGDATTRGMKVWKNIEMNFAPDNKTRDVIW